VYLYVADATAIKNATENEVASNKKGDEGTDKQVGSEGSK
jgi:hypothetical protein